MPEDTACCVPEQWRLSRSEMVRLGQMSGPRLDYGKVVTAGLADRAFVLMRRDDSDVWFLRRPVACMARDLPATRRVVGTTRGLVKRR